MTDSPGTPPQRRIYLDAAASTAVRPEALEAMLPLFSEHFGNPSAHHAGGRASAEALAGARETIAEVLGARAEEIVFTSGGTESINAAIKGVAFAQRDAGAGAHVVTSAVEHHAVLHSMQYLERFGFEVDTVPVDEHGVVAPATIAAAVRDDTVLVSVMYANNEVGTVQPLPAIVEAVRERQRAIGRLIPFHTDAVQAASSLPLAVDTLGVDLLSLSRAQVRRAEGRGAALHPPWRAVPGADLGRRPGAAATLGDGERARRRRLRHGTATRAGRARAVQ